MSFTERLKEARISVGYTQQQVADAEQHLLRLRDGKKAA